MAAQAHWTSNVLSQGAPLRSREDLRLPALSFWPGHRPAQETRCPSVETGSYRFRSRKGSRLPPSSQCRGWLQKRGQAREREPRPGSRLLIDPGDCLHPPGRSICRDGRGQGVVLTEVKPQHEPVMIRQPAVQRIVERFGRGLDPPVSQLRQLLGLRTPGSSPRSSAARTAP